MTRTFSIVTERVDDIPLLLQQMQQMHLAEDSDMRLHPHDNPQGISLSWLSCMWLCHKEFCAF